MLSDWWDSAEARPVSYVASAGQFTAPPLGWILHVTAMRGSPWGVFEHAPVGRRKFSHLWVSRVGLVEQYAPLTGKSWAQATGNGSYLSVETDGHPDEPLTDAQLDVLAAWHVWCGATDQIAEAPGQMGIGTHEMGGNAWGNHACPGHVRSAQRAEIITRARALRSADVALTDAEITAIATRTRDLILAVSWGTKPDGTTPYVLGDLLGEVRINAAKAARGVVDVNALAAAITAQIPTGASPDVKAIASAVADELSTRLVR